MGVWNKIIMRWAGHSDDVGLILMGNGERNIGESEEVKEEGDAIMSGWWK